MTTWQEFAQYRASKQPFLKRITTLDGFYNACRDSSFLALSIKDVKKTSDSDRVVAQVGLAYLPSLDPDEHLECSSANMPSLVQFYNHKRVKALTLNVLIPKDDMRQILANGEMPVRRNVRFGQHQDGVLAEYLDASISGFLDGCLHNAHSKDRYLVCVGFNQKAWTYMRDYFPNALSYFSAYMDLRDIARDATPYTGHIPSLKKCLELFHFKGELTGTEKVGEKTDNAGEIAVGVCAFATILVSEENQEKFQHRMECATMARHWEHKTLRRTFTAEARFLVSVCTVAREALPYELNSSWKIAQNFYSWYPKYAVRASRTEAYVQFHNKPDMEVFIRETNGAVYPSGEVLSVMTYEEREEELEEELGQEDCDNQEEEEQQEENQQQQETQERTAWNSAREVWSYAEEEFAEEESEEEEEDDDGDEMPELVEADPEADWEVLFD